MIGTENWFIDLLYGNGVYSTISTSLNSLNVFRGIRQSFSNIETLRGGGFDYEFKAHENDVVGAQRPNDIVLRREVYS